MTEITQADRDAAYSFSPSRLELDEYQRHKLALAFARHRLEERAKIVAWLRDSPHFINSHGVADAIDRGDHLK